MKDLIRIVIADDHPIVREGLIRTIEHEKSFTIVGQAGDGAEALRLIGELHPDIAVLDIAMPVMDGIEVARRVQEMALLSDLVLLTMYRDPEYFEAAMDLGVRGYLLKESVTTDFLSCLRAVASGEHYISPVIGHLLVERKRRPASKPDSRSFRELLSPAELSVLRLVSENKTNREIAESLFVSVRTVENHRARISQKLGIKGHNKLLEFALKHKGKF